MIVEPDMLIEEVTAVLGRRPNDDELTFIKSVMGSKQIQYPFPALNSIIMGDGHGSVGNGHLSIGLEGKSNIIKTKAKMQCAAQGGKGQLKISFPNAKFLVCDKINSEYRKPVLGDNLIYLKAATDAEVTLLNVWNEAHLGAVTVVNQGGLGVSILSICSGKELGVDLILKNKRQLGDYNNRNISGFLFSVPKADLKKIYKLKKRPKYNPSIVHYSNLKQLKNDCVLNNNFFILYKKFCPGPITFVLKLKNNSNISKKVTNNKKTLAIRFPNHPLTKKLLRSLKYPLAAPSANISSKISAVSKEDVQEEFGRKIKFILDGGQSEIGLESTIISLIDRPKILRLGGMERIKINRILKKNLTSLYV